MTMSYLTQMLALTVQNFVSAATGMAVLVALIRGIARHSAKTIGNFWVDLTRTTLYILLPLSLVLALVLVSQGVVQTFSPYQTASSAAADDRCERERGDRSRCWPSARRLRRLPSSSWAPTAAASSTSTRRTRLKTPPRSRTFLEMLSILLIPAALCYTFGKMVGDTRQGWALLAAMTIIFVVIAGLAVWAEQSGNPAFTAMGVDQTARATFSPGGNMEGKEVRFGIANSALWATATTAASNGSVNSMHDSFTPLGGLVPLFMMQLGEIIFGGVGSGLYGMLAFVIVAVFVAGLMVGRTPEYLGKKIEAYEMKMASLMLLIPILVAKVGTASPWSLPAGLADHLQPRRRTASAKCSTPFPRQPTTTAAPLPGWARTRRSTTPRWASACSSRATGWPSRPWPSPGRWCARRRSRPARAPCPRTPRCSSPGSSASSSSSAR